MPKDEADFLNHIMNAEDLEVRSNHVAKIALAALLSRGDVDATTLAELRQVCLETSEKEFPALIDSAQAAVCRRAQLLVIRIWAARSQCR